MADEFEIDPNGWMLTFGDLITLLLTFFVLLLTMKSMDNKDVKDVIKSVSSSVTNIKQNPIQIAVDKSGGSSFKNEGKFRISQMITNSAALKKMMEIIKEIDTLEEDVPIDQNSIPPILEINEDERGISISLESDYLFEPGEASVSLEKYPILDNIGKMIRYTANRIIVMGHTDNTSAGKSKDNLNSNWELSFYRALSVSYYLIDNWEINPKRISCGGYGDIKPLYPNTTSDNRSKNRRIEFILRKPAYLGV
ncbi:MAG: OmpA family protein [Desulfobacterales bacterium]|nr:OmpA family protein [Desulfobacterales bacterium]